MTNILEKLGEDDVEIIPLEDSSDVFTTYDLNCSAALLCTGYELLSVDKENPRKALYIFKQILKYILYTTIKYAFWCL